jgi:hypothetical protein
VPAVAGGDQHRVEVGPLGQELPDLGEHRAVLVAVLFIDVFLDRLALDLLEVADGEHADVLLAHDPTQVVHAAPADADRAELDLLAGWHRAVASEHARRDDRREGQQGSRLAGGLQKLSAGSWGCFHGLVLVG